jgi:hypothetical protein
MLPAHVSAMASKTHLKSELIVKFTTAIQPIEAQPPIMVPATANG